MVPMNSLGRQVQRIVGCHVSEGKKRIQAISNTVTAHLVAAIAAYGRCLSLRLPAQSLTEQWEQNDWVSSALGQDLISLTTT